MNLKQKLLALLLSLGILGSFIPASLADSDFEPYQKTFVISAYYSPLPNQRVYFRGTYEADVRLNGNGTNGADGTQVYPGMLAAPKTYPFGMKIQIPGLGVGAIHDRGGAIVLAGERAIATHDRLDVWMGKGEEGLARALQWGVRTVTATVYPASHSIAESFTLPSMSNVFISDLSLGDSGDEVKELQEELKIYGYYRDPVDGFFNSATEKALLGYQLARRIVASTSDSGAGILGPQTRESLNSGIFKRTWKPPASLLLATANAASGVSVTTSSVSSSTSRFPTTLSIGDKGDLVKDLQVALTESGFYECEINGIYDEKMEDCVYKFQETNGVLSSRDEFGAGYFGEQTRKTLADVLDDREEYLATLVAARFPDQTLSPNDKNEDVAKLQEGLNELGFYTGKISSSYDSATRNALIAFQIDSGVIAKASDYGSGFFGPKTKTAFEKSLRENLSATPALPENPEWNRAVYVAYTPSFEKSLSLGDAGEEVAELQEVLIRLGYSEVVSSGNFDDATETAVLDFQIKAEVIASADDVGAGVFGPKTRSAMSTTVEENNIALTKKEGVEA